MAQPLFSYCRRRTWFFSLHWCCLVSSTSCKTRCFCLPRAIPLSLRWYRKGSEIVVALCVSRIILSVGNRTADYEPEVFREMFLPITKGQGQGRSRFDPGPRERSWFRTLVILFCSTLQSSSDDAPLRLQDGFGTTLSRKQGTPFLEMEGLF